MGQWIDRWIDRSSNNKSICRVQYIEGGGQQRMEQDDKRINTRVVT